MKCFYGLVVMVEAIAMMLIGIIMIFSAEKAMADVTTLGLVAITVTFLFFRGDLRRYKKAIRGEPINSLVSQVDEFTKRMEKIHEEQKAEEKAKKLEKIKKKSGGI